MIFYYIFLLIFFADISYQYRLVNISKNVNSLTNYNSISKGKALLTKLESIIPKKDSNILKTVIPLDTKSVQAIPFTNKKSSLSSSSFSSSPTSFPSDDTSESFSSTINKVEDGVGPPPAFELTLTSPVSVKTDPLDNYFTEEGDLKIEISDVEPVYVAPPNGFKPVIYPNRALDGIAIEKYQHRKIPTLNLPSQPYPYKYPNGMASWMLGGTRGLERGGYWESLGSDTALYKPSNSKFKQVFNKDSDLLRPKWIQILPESSKPYYHGRIFTPFSPSAFDYTKKTLHPSTLFGLSSWLFGGIRDLDSSIWQSPSLTIEKIEVVPITNIQPLTSVPSSSSSQSSSNSIPSSNSPSFFPLYWF